VDTHAPSAAGVLLDSLLRVMARRPPGTPVKQEDDAAALVEAAVATAPITAAAGSSTGPLAIDLDLVGV
jgi:hypothetical protein